MRRVSIAGWLLCALSGTALAQGYDEPTAAPTPAKVVEPTTTKPDNPAADKPVPNEPSNVGRIWTKTGEPVSEELSAQLTELLKTVKSTAPGLMLNGVLTDIHGRTLYVFDADKRGASTCYKICIQLWPPYLATFEDQPRDGFTITERFDGGLQWVWNNRPLYYWVHDEKAGDITGDGVNDVWHVVRQ